VFGKHKNVGALLIWSSGSRVTTKFVQLHFFGRTKDIMSPLVQMFGGHDPPGPLKLGPCSFAFSVISVMP